MIDTGKITSKTFYSKFYVNLNRKFHDESDAFNFRPHCHLCRVFGETPDEGGDGEGCEVDEELQEDGVQRSVS